MDIKHREPFPQVVCLCGSTKFKEAFMEANKRFTLEGKIVLSVGSFMHADSVPITEEQKIALDKLHFRKIDLCDAIHVINIGGYIGQSTRNEIEYAQRSFKPITYEEPLE